MRALSRWTDHVYSYCERGLDPSFWAEPLNALSNAAFVAVAIAGWQALQAEERAAHHGPFERAARAALVVLVGLIGVGSFLFHTFATRWARLADVLPITMFMMVYLGYALRAFTGLGWLPVAVILPAFLGFMLGASAICPPATGAGAETQAMTPCLNGSLAYVPALAALAGVAIAAWRNGHPARGSLLAATLLVGLSLALRTVDAALCAETLLLGKARGTHALWHLLNALALHLLLVAAATRAAPRPAG